MFFVQVTFSTDLIPWDSSPLQTQHLVGFFFTLIFPSIQQANLRKGYICLFVWVVLRERVISSWLQIVVLICSDGFAKERAMKEDILKDPCSGGSVTNPKD